MFRQNFCCLLVILVSEQINGIWSAAARNGSVIQSRIKGGTNADINNTQFVVSIRTRAAEEKAYGTGFECGGSLISDNVVLTAAHCLFVEPVERIYGKAKSFVVVMGNLNSMKRDKYTLQFNVKKFVTAPITDDFVNDIALVFLDGTVPKNHPTAKPVILHYGMLVDGAICQAYGWGNDGNDIYPDILQVVDLPIMTYQTCIANIDYGELLQNVMFCAGSLEGGNAACDGDSGGPLVCKGIQVGVTSWSKDCGAPMNPGAFSNVAVYRAWTLKHAFLNSGTSPIFQMF